MIITKGNDEFILYIRKQYPENTLENDTLGRLIWQRVFQLDTSAKKLGKKDCYWGDEGNFVGDTKLPKTAEQYRFNYIILPDIYKYVDELGRQ